MNKLHTTIVILCIILCSMSYGQKLSLDEAQQLADDLNRKLSETCQLRIEENRAVLHLNDMSKTLDVRNSSEISQDSITRINSITRIKRPKAYYHEGRYVGAIFWIYDFKPVTTSKASFRANKFGQLFFTLAFQKNDTININSMLNEFTSHHPLSDSHVHKVQWTGDTYISVLLQPDKVGNAVKFRVQGITVSGKFERTDKNPTDKNYSKNLRIIFRREFQNFFDEILLTLSGPEDNFTVSSINSK